MVNECWGSPVTPEAWMPTHGGTEVVEGTEGLEDGVRCTTLPTPAQAPARLFHGRYWPFLLGVRLRPCGCQFGLMLDSKGEVDGEVIIPPERKSA